MNDLSPTVRQQQLARRLSYRWHRHFYLESARAWRNIGYPEVVLTRQMQLVQLRVLGRRVGIA